MTTGRRRTPPPPRTSKRPKPRTLAAAAGLEPWELRSPCCGARALRGEPGRGAPSPLHLPRGVP